MFWVNQWKNTQQQTEKSFLQKFFLKTNKLILKKSNSRNTNFARGSVHANKYRLRTLLRGSHSYQQSFSKSRAAALLCNRLYDHIWTLGKSTCWGFVEFGFVSVAVKKNVWRHGPFVLLVLLKLTVPGLWGLYFGVLSRQISFWTFLELQLTILACRHYASCACWVNIKFRAHVYSVCAWISLDSLAAVASVLSL